MESRQKDKRMFDILKLPVQDSHVKDFEDRAEQACRDGNERDVEHWQSMASMERAISESVAGQQARPAQR